ncbi:hypothetical protein Poly30_38620 [Planctomycetes bacterium Poly30]|uniref:FMN-binding domain-containing protein n=1 Tax=Saltatorellus ferox TaxID=2528018 RepID=A0A518EW74_9BACT|nr:hypothetical protein Poly30_38620 [Planctomycetes bacterium Poly30]
MHSKTFSRKACAAVFVLGWLLSFAAMGDDKKPSAIDEALEGAFPGAEIERVTCVLTPKQRERVGKLGGQSDYPRKTTFAYVAKKDGVVLGTAFFDSHKVRTKRETLMLVVAPDGSLQSSVTIAFQEPPEYVAQDSFYASLKGRRQGKELQLGRGLDGTTGATLTCRAVAEAARRVLGLHEVLGEKVGRKPEKPENPPEEAGR